MLLLAFVRVLLPDDAVLALHWHAHTEHEAAHAPGDPLKGKTVVSEKHRHCPIDHLFNAPALPAPTFVFGLVVPVSFARPPDVARPSVGVVREVQTRFLRGPPTGFQASGAA